MAFQPLAHVLRRQPPPDHIRKPRGDVVKSLGPDSGFVRRRQHGEARAETRARGCRCARNPGARARRSRVAHRAPPVDTPERFARCWNSRCSLPVSVRRASAGRGTGGSSEGLISPKRASRRARPTCPSRSAFHCDMTSTALPGPLRGTRPTRGRPEPRRRARNQAYVRSVGRKPSRIDRVVDGVRRDEGAREAQRACFALALYDRWRVLELVVLGRRRIEECLGV